MATAIETMMSLKNESQIANLSRFFKTGKGQYGEGDLFLGIKVPQTRQVVKELWKECTMSDVEEMISSPFHEIRLCALLVLVQKYKHEKSQRQGFIDFYISHTQYINNWDLVDLSCYETLGHWLLDKDRTVLYNFASDGKTIWEQRIGMVSCMQFVRHDEFDDCLNIADILLHHSHDLINKAVGWLLREVGNRDGGLLRQFLSTRYKAMPRTTLRYAIEKFPEEERKKYLVGLI